MKCCPGCAKVSGCISTTSTFPTTTRVTRSGAICFFPQESSLLYAFLSGNARYRVEASLSMVHYAAPDGLKRLIPLYQPNDQTDGLGGADGKHFPSSAWLRCIAGP